MKQGLFILFIVLLLATTAANAQDVHFSQTHATPLFNNPAMTGLINGDLRAAAVYRNFTVGQGSGYQTITGSVDTKLFKAVGNNDWLSGGLMVYHDQAGALNLSTNSFDVSLAYNAGLGGKGHFLSLGIQGGMQQRSLDLSNAQFGNQYNGVEFDGGMAANETIVNQQYWIPKMSAGLMYYYLSNSRTYFYSGASAFHINKATNSFTGLVDEEARMKMQFIAGGSFPINQQLDLVPSLYGAWQEIYSQINVGTSVRYVISSSGEHSALSIGPYVRFADFTNAPRMEAVILAGRVEWEDLTMGVSYDYSTTARQTASNSGAIELSLVYQIQNRSNNNRGRGGATSCPRF